jgi:uncharacterized membrane protein/mono/diheme cytochrome c family protein
MTIRSDRMGRLQRSLFTLAPILVVLGLAIFLPPDGTERATWMQFAGRFHLVVIHFPIALVLLVPLLELAGFTYRFEHLRLSSQFVLALATFSATVAAFLGWFLARSGAFTGRLITQHMWGGVAVAVACWLCWRLRARTGEAGFGALYSLALVACVVIVSWTGYRGGQLTEGENHLTEFMPEGLRDLLGVSGGGPPAAAADPNTFYGASVEPIFAKHCVSCHSVDKEKGNLRLDSFAGLMKGGKHGVVIKAGDVKGSELIRRVTLPHDNDDFMPKEGKPPLSADQIKVIELWITAGASSTLARDGIKDAPTNVSASAAPVEITFPEFDSAAVDKLRAEIAPKLAEVQKRFPNILEYESRASANLIVHASLLGPKFGDNEMAALAPLAGNIVSADFSRTAITDHSAGAIAAMKNLRVLRLMQTSITDASIQGLSGLTQLQELSVFGTKVTAASLPAVAQLPKLEHYYAAQTAIPAGVQVPPALTGKLVL